MSKELIKEDFHPLEEVMVRPTQDRVPSPDEEGTPVMKSMSKELEVLERHRKSIDDLVNNGTILPELHYVFMQELDIIETALKEKEKQDEVLQIFKRCYQRCPDNNKVFGFTHYENYEDGFTLDTFIIGNACFQISEKERDLLKEWLK